MKNVWKEEKGLLCKKHDLTELNDITASDLIKICPECKDKLVNFLFKKYQVMIERRAYSWIYAENCKTNICLAYEDLIAIGYEVFVNCIKDWNPEKATFCTLLYKALNNRFNMENGYKKIKASGTTYEDCFKSDNCDNVENKVAFKMKLETLSPKAQHVVMSVLNTPYALILQSKKETGRVVICKKRLQRYLIEQENWSIYSCRKVFEEIKTVLNY